MTGPKIADFSHRGHRDRNRVTVPDSPAAPPTDELPVSLSAPWSVWRRIVLAEAAQLETDLREVKRSGPPYVNLPSYDFAFYWDAAETELASARKVVANEWPPKIAKRIWAVGGELFRVWTGSDSETAAAAVHRAKSLYLMIAPDHRLRVEALKIESNFKSSSDIPADDPRHGAYAALFARLKGSSCDHGPPSPVELGDRLLLREILREQNEEWEIARARVRIFRNVLTATIPFLATVLVVAVFIGRMSPSLLPVAVPANLQPGPWDVAVVEFLGAFGGLLSAVATLRAQRNFRRFYGLPLAQSVLKIPAGAASALAGVFLIQHGVLGVAAVSRETAFAYALVFGVAQLAVTKQIDTRAGDLLGAANAKSPSSGQTSPAGRGMVDP